MSVFMLELFIITLQKFENMNKLTSSEAEIYTFIWRIVHSKQNIKVGQISVLLVVFKTPKVFTIRFYSCNNKI